MGRELAIEYEIRMIARRFFKMFLSEVVVFEIKLTKP